MPKKLMHASTVEKRRRERFRAKHPELMAKYAIKRRRSFYLEYTHGMAHADYDALLRVQKGRCAICGRTAGEAGQAHLSVDHCHETGRVRGLLCVGCNFRLGVIKEDPKRAARQDPAIRTALVAYVVTRCVRSREAGPL